MNLLQYCDRSSEKLCFTSITQLPPSIVEFHRLRELVLANNQLKTLPEELANLQNLKILDVSHNALTKFPSVVCNCLTLHGLSVADNKLKTIPANISRLQQLNHIDVSYNRIKSIPSELWTLRQLKVVNMNNNLISSILPNIRRLCQLYWLGLANNVIQSIPDEIGNLDHLRFLDLRNNRLHGVPQGIYDIISLATLLLDGNPMYTQTRHYPVKTTEKVVTVELDNEKTVSYSIGNGFSLSVPPGSVQSPIHLTITTLQDNCLKKMLGDYEMIESDIIEISPNTYEFIQPVTLGFKCPSMNSKSLCIKTIGGRKKWKNVSTKQTTDGVLAKIRKCAMFVVLSTPKVQKCNVNDQGGRIVSEITEDVVIDFPPNAVMDDMCLSMTVHIPDPSLTVTHDSCIKDNVIFGPIVQINEKNKEKIRFEKDVKFSLPVPPSKEDQFQPRTVMVFCDSGDGHWKLITKEHMVGSEKTTEFNVRHFSGYTSISMPRRSSSSKWLTRKCEKLLEVIKLGVFKVQLILMQKKDNPRMLVLSLVKVRELDTKLNKLKELGYNNNGLPYSNVFEMVNGDMISIAVDERFVIESADTPTFTENGLNDYEIIVSLKSHRNSRVQGGVIGHLECTYEGKEQQQERTKCCGISDSMGETLTMKLSFCLPQNAWVASNTSNVEPMVPLIDTRYTNSDNNEADVEPRNNNDNESGLTALTDLVSRELPLHEWKSFGRLRLGLKDIELENIAYDYRDSVLEQKYQMLYLWTRKVGNDASVCRLYSYLQEHKLCRAADKLKQFVTADKN
uniref:P53-induced protein with a death domain-like n=1 Tax=Saccoglossus kowalevskii TaxID=10224 RepID=A0ABM0M7N3_SACKO|nr:PREDICTED: p53-induced protein with a death domain-like [Saccoglossus kowalevskii]